MSTHNGSDCKVGTLEAFEAQPELRLHGNSWIEAKDRFELALEDGEQE